MVSIVSLKYFKKFSWKAHNEDYSTNIYRITCLLVVFLLISLWFIYKKEMGPNFVDPLILRIILSGIILAIFILSYNNKFKNNFLETTMRVLLYLVISWFLGINFINKFPVELAFFYLIAVSIGMGSFSNIHSLTIYTLITGNLTIATLVFTPNTFVNKPKFILIFPTIIAISYFIEVKRNRLGEKLKESEERYRSLFERSIDGIYKSTIEGKYIDASPALVRMLGYDNKEELIKIDIPLQLYVYKDDRPEIKNRDKLFETRLKKKDGTIICVEISSRVVYKKNKPALYESMVRDITKRKKTEEQLKFLSFHDKLTGLYNRAYFEEELKRLNSERQLPLSIIMADINGLKLTNDMFGHKEGDILLCKCVRIFEKCFRKKDIISRWGGDEFIILLPKTTEQKAINIINRIEKECSKSDGQKIPISVSMGSSTKTEKDKNINDVVIEAEEWMCKKKLVESRSSASSIITSLRGILFEKSVETEEHAERTNILALQLGKRLNLSENELAELSLLSTLHDIGKVAIPEGVLLRQGKLSENEWKLIKKHPEVGYKIAISTPYLSHIANAILTHHEWWDGSGYPQGLKGEKFPLTSRILAIVDAYDVMINGRPYKDKMNIDDAIKELKRFSGTQFDPTLVKKLIQILKEES